MTKSVTINYSIAALAAFAVMLAYAGVADAAINSSAIRIEISNTGVINNTTKAKAETGGNTAQGSTGGNGGVGGNVTSGSGDYNNGGASGGNGGNGGNASDGGWVETGDANANAGTENSLNGSDIEVDLTNAVSTGEDVNSTYIGAEIKNGNDEECQCKPEINNTTKARARTGGNTAQGSVGGNGDNGGQVTSGSGDYNNGGASAGTGGAGGSGGIGGTVKTGVASSTAGTVNLLNTTLIRVRL